MLDVTVIILTYNEEIHIERCLNNAKMFAKEIFVVDSFSTDHTVELAEKMGARVYQHPFENQARQFNWGLKNLPITTEWVWRMDADEYVEQPLMEKVTDCLRNIKPDVTGIYVNKKIVFMGRPLLHGGWYPAQQIKIIRKGYGASEDKWMDEHLIVFSGNTISVDGDQTDENLNDLFSWTQKHNNYSGREAANMLLIEYGMDDRGREVCPKFWGTNAERKRWLKLKYVKAPLFLRPFINFIIRYVLKAGFLDGKEGFLWHFLQGFWYRFLVDAKVYELKKRFAWDDDRIKKYLEEKYLATEEKPQE